jgi:DNA-binding beta-propeller fold protein YncE
MLRSRIRSREPSARRTSAGTPRAGRTSAGSTAGLVAAVLLAASGLVAGLVAGSPAVSQAATGVAGGTVWPDGTGVRSVPGSVTAESGNMVTIAVGGLPTSVAVDQVSGMVWVVNSLDNTLSEISAQRRVVVAVIKVGVSPVDVAVDQKTGTVWVTCLGPFGRPAVGGLVDEISEANGKVLASFKVGTAPFGIAADPRTGTVWVADSDSGAVSEISEARQAVVATIRTGPGTEPASLAVDPASGVVWVADLGGLVEEISEASRTVTGGVKVRAGADALAGADARPGTDSRSLNAIAADPGTGAAWVASDSYAGGSFVSYASAVPQGARQVSGGVLVSKPAWYTNIADGIAVDPATSTVWVAENGGNTVTLISAGVRAVARNLITGPGPVAVAVDSRNGTAWVVDNTAGTVTEYSYASPRFTTSAQVNLAPGKRALVQVHTRGFPIAVMAVHGALPPGLRVRIGAGTVVISGKPAASALGRTFRVLVSADNGVGTADGQYVFTQQLVIQVGKVARSAHR